MKWVRETGQDDVWGGAGGGQNGKCRVEQESSRGADELRWGKSSKGYMYEQLGSEERRGRCGEKKARQRQESSP